MAHEDLSNEIEIIRVYDAPVKAVWDAWVDPEQVSQWWGPRGFTLTTRHKDVRPGGTWSYTMHGPDGTNYENITPFLEVEPHRRLVYDHGTNENQPPLFRVTALFSEAESKTTMHLRMTLPSAQAAAETRRFVKSVGGDSTWDRLGEFLAKRLHHQEIFLINRSFQVSLEEMYATWTSLERVSQWLPPTGVTMQVLQGEISPGKELFYKMTGDGAPMFGKVQYLQFEKPHRLVYTQQFCDERGTMARHPMAPTWPESMLTTVTLAAEGPEQTRVTVRWEPHGSVNEAELATFVSGRAGMTIGWTGSFDKLEAALKNNTSFVSEVRLGQTPSGPVAFIHLQIAKHEIQTAMGPAIQEVYAATVAQHKKVTGSWFTVHHRIAPDRWDFDACVPIESELTPVGRVQSKTLKAERAVIGTYVGPYEGLIQAWPALRSSSLAQQQVRKEGLCEIYEVGPESGLPPTQWKTQLVQPIE